MNRISHKIPFAGMVLLTLGGCYQNCSNDADIETVRDTVQVVQYVAPSYKTGQKIWVTDKSGNELYYNNMSLGMRPDLHPNPGDILFVRRGVNKFKSEYLMVLENITAQKMKYAYANGR